MLHSLLCRKGLLRHNRGLIADQRGAIAFETAIIFVFMIISLFFPLVDVAVAGFRFAAAHQALRDMGQRTQYSPPQDVTSSSSIQTWQSSLPATVDGYSVTAQVYCNGTVAPCASGASPKYYKFTTSFTLSPIVLSSVLCSTCTVTYSQPFQ